VLNILTTEISSISKRLQRKGGELPVDGSCAHTKLSQWIHIHLTNNIIVRFSGPSYVAFVTHNWTTAY